MTELDKAIQDLQTTAAALAKIRARDSAKALAQQDQITAEISVPIIVTQNPLHFDMLDAIAEVQLAAAALVPAMVADSTQIRGRG